MFVEKGWQVGIAASSQQLQHLLFIKFSMRHFGANDVLPYSDMRIHDEILAIQLIKTDRMIGNSRMKVVN
jgi:hypothetical protein